MTIHQKLDYIMENQDGYTAIYDALVLKGVTPTSTSLYDLIVAINEIKLDVPHTVTASVNRQNNLYCKALLYVDGVLVGEGGLVYSNQGDGVISTVTRTI